MLCPSCKQNAAVRDTRQQGEFRRRRYACGCGMSFTTLETVVDTGKGMKGLGGRGAVRPTKVSRWKNEIESKAKEQGKAEALEQVRRALGLSAG